MSQASFILIDSSSSRIGGSVDSPKSGLGSAMKLKEGGIVKLYENSRSGDDGGAAGRGSGESGTMSFDFSIIMGRKIMSGYKHKW